MPDEWWDRPLMSPTERLRVYGAYAPDPSSLLTGPNYDVRAHYQRVKALHDAYPYKTKERCQQFSHAIVRNAVKATRLPIDDLLGECGVVIDELLEKEGVYRPTLLSFDPKSSPTYIDLVLRPHLAEAEHFYTQYERILPEIEQTLTRFFAGLLRQLPESAFAEASSDAITLPLIELLPNAAELIHDTMAHFFETADTSPGAPRKFLCLRQQLADNCVAASSGKRKITSVDQLIQPEEFAQTHSITQVAQTYLEKTPLLDLLTVDIPFVIPDQPYRTEHTHILGASGSGKTTLIQQMVLNDIAKPDPPSMIIIDPKGLLVERIQKLDVFNPETGRLKDRLVIIDPTHSPPPALNMFDPASKRFQMYSEQVRQQIENQTISTYAYVFSSVSSTLTAKQQVGFSFVVRLLFSIPGATIHTLLDLMDDKAKSLSESRFAPFIGRLDPTSRRFFENDFYHPTEFRETKGQIKARLFGILVHRSMEAMFSAPERKLDMIDCLQSRKIVLVNTAMGVLGSEGSQLLGRYIITLTLNAAFSRIALPKKDWNFVSLIIDEAQEFMDELKTPELLRLAREYNLGVTLAHQQIQGQLSESLRAAVSTNTSIKYAAAVEGADINYVARDLRCDPDFITSQRRTQTHANFACYVRNFTERAVSISVPLGNIEREPRMSEAALELLLQRNSERVSVPKEKPAPPQPVSATPPSIQNQPSSNNPHPGTHIEAGKDW